MFSTTFTFQLADKMAHSDSHTMFVTDLGPTDEKQLHDALVSYFEACRKVLGIKDKNFFGDWRINVVKRQGDIPIGVAYIFLVKKEAYNVAMGKNVDGTTRKKTIPNPDYKEKSCDKMSVAEIFNAPRIVSWADEMGDHENKTILVDEEPTAVFPHIVLRKTQVTDPKITKVTPFIRPCKAPHPDAGTIHNILVSYSVPPFITEKNLLEIFSPYVTEEKSRSEGYPKISISNRREAQIEFARNTEESIFAQLMTMKTTVVDKDGQKHILVFKYKRDHRN